MEWGLLLLHNPAGSAIFLFWASATSVLHVVMLGISNVCVAGFSMLA